MIKKECIIIGGGPAGLCAATMALAAGCEVLLVERSSKLGGQLTKQTHKFFGSKNQYAKWRGFDIAEKLISEIIDHPKLTVLLNTTVVGLYKDQVITVLSGQKYTRYQGESLLVATGASEKFLAFENNDLPGVYGAGAIQTLMNIYGVLPGKNVVMIGSGNIGLIVSYQLIQAGAFVSTIVEAAPFIGGYKVHASKLVRLGTKILTSTTVKRAIGKDHVEAVEIISLDENFKEVPDSSRIIPCDALCVSVGLSPMHHLLSMIGALTKYIPELGGFVPLINDHFQTSLPPVFAVGDCVGIEEASAAMMEGFLGGLYMSEFLNKKHPNHDELIEKYEKELFLLRDGPYGKKIKAGLKKMEDANQYVE
ncbi:MAG: pyridine nucleotide-disulfide oxidoreductase [Firmicutes bacterium HGW-Firmicutes-20]|jgi:sarcosine oxidase, subunit alpha|nr:MAG: pyridine nucleotide-disulfide oxidoreductase [Firmicutes bacterium HGW-Firmicutes-20]PKM68412.1 MAG: pyridine nucleotide-disulfide oxidoreductase [Firmicutes bacterium HGW-Firmicutes-19]